MLGSLSLQDAQNTSPATWPLVRVWARLFIFILMRRFLPPHFSILDSDFLMQIRFSCPPLPTDWSTLSGSEGIVFSGDVTVSIHSRLKAKILVFRDLAALQRFWRLGLGHRKPPDDTVRAVVNDLSSIVTFHPPKGSARIPPIWQIDPVYFCVAGFVLGNLKMEYITHESVHAAYAYASRVAGRQSWPDKEDPEEHVCYPAGLIASAINQLFHRHRLYDRQSDSDWPVQPKRRKKSAKRIRKDKPGTAASKDRNQGENSELDRLRAALEQRRRGDDIRYHGMKLLLDAGISTSTCLFIPIMEVFQFGLQSPLSHAAAEKLRSEIKSISFPYQVEIQASDEIPSPI
jgi:hypothetical protein